MDRTPQRLVISWNILGVNYLGVAYPNEGIELSENGVTLPILVMNCEEESFASCIEHTLEPAIFSLTSA